MSVQTYARTSMRSCGCAGACSCAAGACTESGLERPSFFAGQLLTDEDLQGLVTYVTGANRLHNRNFLGAGVVCGLEVEKDPCDDSKMILNPGHAVDCCGNDIVVPCQVTKVDMPKLLQELRKRLRGGHDCGDPCKDSRQGAPTPDEEDGALQYNLYLKYCEEQADPVTAFTVDDCSPGGCSPTRIRERFALELDCPTPPPAGPDFITQVEKRWKQTSYKYGETIIKPTVNAFGTIQTAYRVLVQAEKLPGLLHDFGLTNVRDQLAQLTSQINAAQISTSATRRDTLRLLHQGQVWASRVRYTAEFSSLAADAKTLADAIQKVLDRLKGNIETELHPMLDQLNARQKRLGDSPQTDPTKWTLDQKCFLNGELTSLNGNVTKNIDAGVPIAILDGVKAAFTSLGVVKDKLIAAVQSTAITLDARLVQKLRQLGFPDFPADGDSNKFLTDLVSARTVNLAVQSLLQDCFCSSLVPPCPSCDDPRVLLATVDLDNCSVVSVCNLARDFILSGPTLRYWFDNFQTIFGPVRGQCCDPPQQKLDDQGAAYRKILDGLVVQDMGILSSPPGDLTNDDLWTNILGSTYPPAADNTVVRGFFGRFVAALLGLSTDGGSGADGGATQGAVTALTVRVDALEASVTGVQGRVATLEDPITKNLRTDVDEEVRGHFGGTNNGPITRDELRQIFKDVIDNALKPQQAKVDALVPALDGLRDQLGPLANRVEWLKRKADELEARVTGVKTADVAKEVNGLRTTMQDLTKKLSEVKATTDDLFKQVEVLKKTTDDLAKKGDDLNTRMTKDLVPKVAEQGNKTDSLTAQIKTFDDRTARFAESALIQDLTQKPLEPADQKAVIKLLLLGRLRAVDDVANPLFHNPQTAVPADALKTNVKFLRLPLPDDPAVTAALAALAMNIGDLSATQSLAEVVKKLPAAMRTPSVVGGVRLAWKTAQELKELVSKWPEPSIPKLGGP